jgi:hypothetical protein
MTLFATRIKITAFSASAFALAGSTAQKFPVTRYSPAIVTFISPPVLRLPPTLASITVANTPGASADVLKRSFADEFCG